MNKTIILFLLVSSGIYAQDYLTFSDCLEITLRNNVSIKSLAVSEQVSKYKYRASYGALLPSIFATVDNKNSWGREIDSKTNLYVDKDLKNYIGSIGATYNLFSGFAAINSIKSAKKEAQINNALVHKKENEISIELAQKFITIYI